jgi:hypothetical protein
MLEWKFPELHFWCNWEWKITDLQTVGCGLPKIQMQKT